MWKMMQKNPQAGLISQSMPPVRVPQAEIAEKRSVIPVAYGPWCAAPTQTMNQAWVYREGEPAPARAATRDGGRSVAALAGSGRGAPVRGAGAVDSRRGGGRARGEDSAVVSAAPRGEPVGGLPLQGGGAAPPFFGPMSGRGSATKPSRFGIFTSGSVRSFISVSSPMMPSACSRKAVSA
jgi:hypothetical protein